MSTKNITRQYPTQQGYIVVFETSRGERAYMYTLSAGAQIALGADPRNYGGQEIDESGLGINSLAEFAEGAAEAL
jgi:hypothetical protein